VKTSKPKPRKLDTGETVQVVCSKGSVVEYIVEKSRRMRLVLVPVKPPRVGE
jgi:hypothetical protein